MKHKISLIFLFVFSMVFVSAGLQVDNSSFIINKTSGIQQNITFTVINTESFEFFNISSGNEGVLKFPKFDLVGGGNQTITAEIVTDSPFDGNVIIEGDYFANLGQSNETYDITISGSDGTLDICDIEAVVGDTFNWKNDFVSGDVKLKNLDTNQDFATISAQNTYSEQLDEGEFNYQVFKTGIPFSQACNINVRPTQGYIHSAIYDATVNLDIEIFFEPTEINYQFLTTSFTIDANTEQQDVLKVTNIGTNPAKGVTLSGTWFTFEENNFDLAVGESRTIEYTINPIILNTDETNKTYTQNLTISGNFNTINQPLEITIPYKLLSTGNQAFNLDPEAVGQILQVLCIQFPDKCPERVVYSNSSGNNVSFTVTEETYKQGIIEEDEFRQTMVGQFQSLNERVASVEEKTENGSSADREVIEKLDKQQETNDEWLGSLGFIALTVIFSFILMLSLFLYYNDGARQKLKDGLRFTRFEKSW